jgi:hypothetical protein
MHTYLIFFLFFLSFECIIYVVSANAVKHMQMRIIPLLSDVNHMSTKSNADFSSAIKIQKGSKHRLTYIRVWYITW